jgi:hypothetical protein
MGGHDSGLRGGVRRLWDFVCWRGVTTGLDVRIFYEVVVWIDLLEYWVSVWLYEVGLEA